MRAAIRAVLRRSIFLSLMGVSLSPCSGDEIQQTPYLARVPGFILHVVATGDKPCDFNRDKLINDASFVLNAADIDFGKMGDANLDYSSWPTLYILAQGFGGAYGCAWRLDAAVYAAQAGAEVFGLPYEDRVEIWTSGALGMSPGDGLTAYVSGIMQDFVKRLVNDMHAARRKFSATQ